MSEITRGGVQNGAKICLQNRNVRKSSGCIGRCSSEPNVTVEIEGEEPIIYQKMTPDKMRQVFNRHVLNGEVQSDFALD